MRTSCKCIGFFGKCLLGLPLLVLAVGCGSKEGTVTGKVYYKGQLVRSGNVNFFPEAKGAPASGSLISSDGTYTVMKVPKGPAKITVISGSSGAPTAGREMGPGGGMGMKKGMEEQKQRLQEKGKPPEAGGGNVENVNIPEDFGDPEKSKLTVDVTGGKQNFDIKIE